MIPLRSCMSYYVKWCLMWLLVSMLGAHAVEIDEVISRGENAFLTLCDTSSQLKEKEKAAQDYFRYRCMYEKLTADISFSPICGAAVNTSTRCPHACTFLEKLSDKPRVYIQRSCIPGHHDEECAVLYKAFQLIFTIEHEIGHVAHFLRARSRLMQQYLQKRVPIKLAYADLHYCWPISSPIQPQQCHHFVEMDADLYAVYHTPLSHLMQVGYELFQQQEDISGYLSCKDIHMRLRERNRYIQPRETVYDLIQDKLPR